MPNRRSPIKKVRHGEITSRLRNVRNMLSLAGPQSRRFALAFAEMVKQIKRIKHTTCRRLAQGMSRGAGGAAITGGTLQAYCEARRKRPPPVELVDRLALVADMSPDRLRMHVGYLPESVWLALRVNPTFALEAFARCIRIGWPKIFEHGEKHGYSQREFGRWVYRLLRDDPRAVSATETPQGEADAPTTGRTDSGPQNGGLPLGGGQGATETARGS